MSILFQVISSQLSYDDTASAQKKWSCTIATVFVPVLLSHVACRTMPFAGSISQMETTYWNTDSSLTFSYSTAIAANDHFMQRKIRVYYRYRCAEQLSAIISRKIISSLCLIPHGDLTVTLKKLLYQCVVFCFKRFPHVIFLKWPFLSKPLIANSILWMQRK